MWRKLLDILKEENSYVSGSAIGERLGVSRTAVWKNISKLKDMGYEIEAVTNKGYRLVPDGGDIINEAEIKEGLGTAVMGSSVYCFDEVDSTNDRAKRLGEGGAAEGAVVIAETQTSGKGRRGRGWVSAKGQGIWMSLLLRPDIQPAEAPKLTLISGLCMCRAIEEVTGINVGIKWPNDILVNNKKVCGILTEMSAEMDGINYVVTGIGVNVNMEYFDDEISNVATSLRIEGGRTYPRKEIIKVFLRHFEKYYFEYIKNKSFRDFLEEYKRYSVTVGKDIRVISKESFDARAVDINDQGELVVEKPDGEIVVVFSGEVSVRNK